MTQDQDVTQVQRQLYLLSLLSDNPRSYSINDMQQSMERNLGIQVSRKTVERDIDTLSGEFSIGESVRDGSTVYYADKYHLQNIQLTIPELLSLYFTRELLEDYAGMTIASHALDLINRLIVSAPSVHRRFLESVSHHLKVSQPPISPDKNLDPELYETLQQSLSNQQRLMIEYHSFNRNEVTSREFDPYVLEIREGRWHLVGYCHLRQAVRDLRVSRIRQAKVLSATYQPPADFYDTYQKKRFQHLAGDQRICLKLLFTGQAARLVEEYYGENARLTYTEKGHLIYQRTITMSDEVIMWVQSFGPAVQVLEPEDLRRQIRDSALTTAVNYE